MDRGAGMAEQFMTNWRSGVFRDKCAAQIHSARSQIDPKEDSDDPMERFFAQNSTVQLEEFVFNKSKTREEYVSLIAEMVMMLRQHGGKPKRECIQYPCQRFERLKEKIRAAAESVTVEMLQKKWQELERQPELVLRNGGWPLGGLNLKIEETFYHGKGVNVEVLEKANPEQLASAGVTAEGLDRVKQDTNTKEQNGENSGSKN